MPKEIENKIIDEIIALSKNIKGAFISLAEKLKKIRDERLYIQGGHETFWQFCEEDLDMWESQASRLITTYEKLVLKFGISPAKLINTWNSAYLIASASETKEQALNFIEKNLAVSELKKAIADIKGGEEHRHIFEEIHLRQCKKCGLREKIYEKD